MNKRMIVILLVMSAVSAQAATGKGSLMVAAFGGAGFSSSKLDLGNTGGDDFIAKGGGASGAQVVYFFKDQPAIGFGIDGSYTHLRDRDTTDLVFGANAKSHLNSTVILAIAKLAYPTGHVRPYVFGGLGTHRSTVFTTAQPFAPYAWSDTSTSENRVLIDETRTSLAIGYGVGLDVFLTDEFFVGAEYRGIFLAHRDFDQTAGATSAGLRFEDNSLDVEALLLRIGVKFGT